MLKRGNVPLDRDVIFLAEVRRRGRHAHRHRVHGPRSLQRHRRRVLLRRRRRRHAQSGAVRYAQIQTTEKVPNGIDSSPAASPATARCRCRPTRSRISSKAVAAVAEWQPPINLNDTTRAVLQAAGRHLAAGARAPLPQRRERQLEADGRVRRVAARERAAPRVDAAHVGVAEHHPGRLPQQRDPVRGQGHARRPDDSRREPASASSRS